jgi:NAD(P)-dependent dehydrogenase (short-subunit alcohol dehydrogenase family)
MALTRSVAYDYGKAGVRCNTICPGYIETPATAPLLSDSERKAWLMEKLLLPYTGLPADIANAALYLASDASRYMNGQVMTVDGGRTIS